ncbi:MAG: CinA family nicotinamide mononucleotide deamidase-related protein [Verrucomicrobia bacterium]|nr:CinA family nicotinamide mononucleotide deamidase-related protein [Verrucomicrobiota bacterium]MBV9658791.1 CinA family nicotinamide mononucleotide deamidase-related protein [Verrucomicrobiota bacterium]
MNIEILNTGTELLLGSVINTHLAFFGEALFGLGLRIARQSCVPDGPPIGEALQESFRRGADVVLATGGLGPTSDDITRDLVAQLLGRELREDAGILSDIRAKFAKFGRKTINPNIARQAQVPAGAQVLYNHHGTAPGLYVPAGKDAAGAPTPHLFLLPGPPREMRPMFSEQVLPILKSLLPAAETPPGLRLYRLVGIGESAVEEQVGEALAALGGGLEIGYCARSGEVDLRLIGEESLLARAEAIVVPALQKYLVSSRGESLEQVIVRLLREQKKTLAVAESCTGGLLAHRLTNVTGASDAFPAGLTTYIDPIKTKLLGVAPETIAQDGGAVSAPVASAMAAGVRQIAGTDYALSTTGFAGPDGGREGKPIGTIFIGLATPGRAEPLVKRMFFPTTDRETFKYRAAQAAFDLLRRELIGQGET